MALKRKEMSADGAESRKKFRRGLADDADSCNDDTFDGEDMDAHLEGHVGGDVPGPSRSDSRAKRLVCDAAGCGQTFSRPSHLEAHMRVHTGERPFVCPLEGCTSSYNRKDHLDRHIKSIHEKQRDFACEFKGCSKRFFDQKGLRYHQEVHENKYYCTDYPPCHEPFRKKATLNAHINSAHLGLKAYPCTHVDEETGEQCMAAYQQGQALKRHIEGVHSAEAKANASKRHFCMLCPEIGTELDMVQTENGSVLLPKQPLSFVTKEEYAAHKDELHPPMCLECDQKFKSASGLQNHLDHFHPPDGQVPSLFPCPEPGCDRAYSKKCNLNVHINTAHKDKRDFVCGAVDFSKSRHEELRNWDGGNACQGAYKHKSGLEQHIRVHHLGLPNRKEARKEKKKASSTAKQQARMGQTFPKPSALALLTGIGYEKTRNIECLVGECETRYMRDVDMVNHLADVHKLSEDEIDALLEARREKEALAGGRFWVGGLDEVSNRSQLESVQSSVPQTPLNFPSPGYEQEPLLKPAADSTFFNPKFPSLGDPMRLEPLLEEDAKMDELMGLTNVPLADIRDGLQNNDTF